MKQWQLLEILLVGILVAGQPLMASESLLSEAEIVRQLAALPGWKVESKRLRCTYGFSNFVEAIDYVNRLVEPAETAGHHPDLEIAYNRVTIALTTHDAGGLTEKDFALARTAAQLAAPLQCQ